MARKQRFIMEEWVHYSRLGLRRKKLLKYRKARGRDSKVRLKMKGHLRNVEVGFKKEASKRGLIEGKIPILIHNLNDLKDLKGKEIGIIGKIGNKKRMEIAEYCIKNKIELLNLNNKRFLEKMMEEIKRRKEKRMGGLDKRKEKKEKTEETQSQKTKTDDAQKISGEDDTSSSINELDIINKNKRKENPEDEK